MVRSPYCFVFSTSSEHLTTWQREGIPHEIHKLLSLMQKGDFWSSCHALCQGHDSGGCVRRPLCEPRHRDRGLPRQPQQELLVLRVWLPDQVRGLRHGKNPHFYTMGLNKLKRTRMYQEMFYWQAWVWSPKSELSPESHISQLKNQMRCPKSKFSIMIIVIAKYELMVNKFQACPYRPKASLVIPTFLCLYSFYITGREVLWVCLLPYLLHLEGRDYTTVGKVKHQRGYR